MNNHQAATLPRKPSGRRIPAHIRYIEAHIEALVALQDDAALCRKAGRVTAHIAMVRDRCLKEFLCKGISESSFAWHEARLDAASSRITTELLDRSIRLLTRTIPEVKRELQAA